MSNSKKSSTSVQHPLCGSSLNNLMRLLIKSGGIEQKYVSKMLYTLFLSVLGMPLRVLEQLKFGRTIASTQIALSPIFVLGHWRSGTTHLHRLMAEDNNLGYVSSLQAFLPESFLGIQQNNHLDLEELWPKERLMDKVTYAPNVPEEEEYALGNVLPLSFYQCWYFPRKMREIFTQSVLLDGISDALKEEWKAAFIKILKKTTLEHGGKRLVVKNPANTSRIKILLELFPNAKFIHIYRNPYDVYSSTLHFYKKLLPHYQFQEISTQNLESNIFFMYEQLMHRYFETVSAIPEENFIEITYEDFDLNEMNGLRRIYSKLGLPGFEASAERFKDYIDTHANYQKNHYALDEHVEERVRQHWGFAIDRWQALREQAQQLL